MHAVFCFGIVAVFVAMAAFRENFQVKVTIEKQPPDKLPGCLTILCLTGSIPFVIGGLHHLITPNCCK